MRILPIGRGQPSIRPATAPADKRGARPSSQHLSIYPPDGTCRSRPADKMIESMRAVDEEVRAAAPTCSRAGCTNRARLLGTLSGSPCSSVASEVVDEIADRSRRQPRQMSISIRTTNHPVRSASDRRNLLPTLEPCERPPGWSGVARATRQPHVGFADSVDILDALRMGYLWGSD